MGVAVAVGVLLGVTVGVRVGVRVGVFVDVAVGVAVGVSMMMDWLSDVMGTVVPSAAAADATLAVLLAGLHAPAAVKLTVTVALAPADSGPRLFQLIVFPACELGDGAADTNVKQPLWNVSVRGTVVSGAC